MIRLRDVCKVYPTRQGPKLVLDNLSFDLEKGERLGVLGRNGAGKSTMVRLISGAEFPTSGLIEREMSVSWPLAFGGAFQVMLTGVDNVRFISRIYNQDFEKNLAFVEDFSELGSYLREPVRNYSSGMRARLAFAISMIIEFDCFLIDEVGAVGDARFHERCNYELFDKRGDRAMVIISHDAGYIRDHCNRFAVLHDAKISMYDDFDLAYSEFKELIGALPTRVEVEAPLADLLETEAAFSRVRLIEQTHRIAVHDERFRALVLEGGFKANERNWPKAEALYAQALTLFPYERSYWAQLGHMQKENGDFSSAELSYRTANALGDLHRQEVIDHIRAVMAAQGISEEEFPIPARVIEPTFAQPPGKPDALILALLFWRTNILDNLHILDMIRNAPTMDRLAANIVTDDRCDLSFELDKAERPAVSVDWLRALGCLAFSEDQLQRLWLELSKLGSPAQVLRFVLANDGFNWPEMQIALNAKRDREIDRQLMDSKA